jgi:transposase
LAFREVTMIELKEVLRQWLAGAGKKRIGARVGLDPKTVRRYVRAAQACGLHPGAGVPALTDDVLAAVVAGLTVMPTREHGEAWGECEKHREFIQDKLSCGVKLTKVRRLLRRQGVVVPYSTLHRFAVAELAFGRPQVTVPVVDGIPGDELQVDTGWMILLEPDEHGRRRRFRAWIFTPNFSRYRFVWPCLRETTQSAIEACEAAWEFYGGVFRTLVPDNTKSIVIKADPLEPKFALGFLEYAQARGFLIDPTRVRKAKDKARVERSVQDVRNDCFGGEHVRDIEHARALAHQWSLEGYGMRRHSTTQRYPREHFEAVEKPALLAAPTEPYDIPTWADPKVGRDHFAQVESALYTLPTIWIGKRLRARADSQLVRFYYRNELIKTHPRKLRGGKSIDENDFPADRRPYAMRDVAWLQRQAETHGESVGMFAKRLLEGRLPWTKMRAVRALLGLCQRFGDTRVEQTCARALAADMLSVRRLERMLQLAAPAAPTPIAKVIPIGRYLRPSRDYAVPRSSDRPTEGEEA